MSAPVSTWQPQEVGELFIMVMPGGARALMRVTELVDGARWSATSADLDDAMRAHMGLPVYTYTPLPDSL